MDDLRLPCLEEPPQFVIVHPLHSIPLSQLQNDLDHVLTDHSPLLLQNGPNGLASLPGVGGQCLRVNSRQCKEYNKTKTKAILLHSLQMTDSCAFPE
jgi:hypothetical protein